LGWLKKIQTDKGGFIKNVFYLLILRSILFLLINCRKPKLWKTNGHIKTAFDKEIARQRTATIALVKEETEIYDIAIGQQVDGVVLFPLGEQAAPFIADLVSRIYL
jgi:hypothetical protein